MTTNQNLLKQITEFVKNGNFENNEGEIVKINSGIDYSEGELLFKTIVNDINIKKTLEIGCAYGISSIYICSALSQQLNTMHTIVDPFQSVQWLNYGINNLKKFNLSNFNLIEERSEIILPELLKSKKNYDFIFIDGWHTFDHTMVDVFYSLKLLNNGGYLVIDDVDHPAVRKVFDYIINYDFIEVVDSIFYNKKLKSSQLFFRLIIGIIPLKYRYRFFNSTLINKLTLNRPIRMVVLKKIKDDNRSWNWFSNNF